MKRLVVLAMLIAAPGVCGAQGLLDFRRDLAFDAGTVETVAEHTYRARLRSLAVNGRLDRDPALLLRLRGLIARLTPAAQFERPASAAIDWEIHTCRRCGENASAMAGGKLLVGEEFIAELAPTDDEIGYVLAHEMAHVLAEHTREFATTARSFVGNGWNRDYEDIQNELDESLAVNLRMAVVYAQQELEADYMGFILGARSGFVPEAMPRMLHKLHADAASAFLLHPSEHERIRRVQAMMQTARRVYHMGIPARH
jgi:predicted Zn-dependent protease